MSDVIIDEFEIPAVSEISREKAEENDEIFLVDKNTNIVAEGNDSLESLEINFTLFDKTQEDNRYGNSTYGEGVYGLADLTLNQQREKLKEIAEQKLSENIFAYNGIVGRLSIEDISFAESSSEQNIRTGTISASFLPWPKHFSEDRPVIKINGGYGSGVYGKGIYGDN